MASRLYFAWKMFETARAKDERNYMSSVRTKARTSSNSLRDLPEGEFKRRYRLPKKAVRFLCRELRQLTGLKSSQRVTLEDKVLTALFFYASGSYQRPVGVAKNISQKMCSVYIEEVTKALTHKNIINKYIKFPNTPSARQAVSQRFCAKYRIPGVIGCIDCSHFRIFGPPKTEEHLYYCRKHYHSMNVQMICDDQYRILNVNAKFGGANHDSFIWENSDINSYMQLLHQNGEIVWLLGDSGYPQRPWLMTPILDAAPDTLQANYNQKHVAARVVIENTFGRLKNRWRCLNKDRVLHYKPLKCARIIQACCILHNIGLDYNVVEEEDITGLDHDEHNGLIYTEREIGGSTSDLIRGRVLRDQLVRRLQHF